MILDLQMGNKNAKYSKADRVVLEKVKQDKINKVTENVTNFQKSILQNNTSNTSTNNRTNNSQIVKTNVQEQEQTNKLLNATLIAQTQLHRGGNTFTKDDMFAIFLYVKTSSTGVNMFEKSNDYQILNRDDLVTAIRTIVYDPVEISKLLHKDNYEHVLINDN